MMNIFSMLALALALVPLPVLVLVKKLEDLDCPPANA